MTGGKVVASVRRGDEVVELLRRKEGATIEEMVTRFGVMPHTLRAIISVGLAALRVSSRLWANVGFSLAITLLVAAIAGLIYQRGASRAYSLGFVLFGWPYLLIAFGPAPFNAWRDLLVTTPALLPMPFTIASRQLAPPVRSSRIRLRMNT